MFETLPGYDLGGFGGIPFERQALDGLQSSGNTFLAWLGAAHVVLQAPEEFIYSGVVNQLIFRRFGRASRRCRLFVLVHGLILFETLLLARRKADLGF